MTYKWDWMSNIDRWQISPCVLKDKKLIMKSLFSACICVNLFCWIWNKQPMTKWITNRRNIPDCSRLDIVLWVWFPKEIGIDNRDNKYGMRKKKLIDAENTQNDILCKRKKNDVECYWIGIPKQIYLSAFMITHQLTYNSCIILKIYNVHI